MVAGRYFDGVSSRARAALFGCAHGALIVECEGARREVAAADLRFAPSRGAAPSSIAIRGGGLCEMANTEESRALMKALGAREPVATWLESHRPAVFAAAVAFAALMALAWKWGIPRAADVIVDRMPPAWDARLGDGVLRQLEDNGVFRPSEVPAPRQARNAQAFARLGKRADAPAYRIVFRRLGVPNAFALPGGAIVVADELVALAPDDDALSTVLGHELGHLQYRHGMRSLVRATLFSAVAAWYLGDFSGFAASAAAGITALSYSRAAEREADRYALALMHGNGISTHGAALLFGRLARWQPEDTPKGAGGAKRIGLPEYLNTHPDIDDRIRLFDAGPDPAATDRGTGR